MRQDRGRRHSSSSVPFPMMVVVIAFGVMYPQKYPSCMNEGNNKKGFLILVEAADSCHVRELGIRPCWGSVHRGSHLETRMIHKLGSTKFTTHNDFFE
jgi:hypothetical protein